MDGADPPRAARVAVVVVAWLDRDDLDDCLSALTLQTMSDFTVVVADNGAGLHERLRRWHDDLSIVHVDLGDNIGVSAARNAAVAAVDADLLLFLDDDAVPEARWVEAFVDLMHSTNAVAARGRVTARHAGVLNDLARAYDLGPSVRPAILNTEGNCAIRASAYAAVGGFREDMYGHEGAELSHRLLEQAADPNAIVYTPDAVIRHDYVDDLGGYFRKKYRHGTLLRQVDPAVTAWAASRARRKSPWTVRRVVMAPIKALGLVAEGFGFGRSLVRAS